MAKIRYDFKGVCVYWTLSSGEFEGNCRGYSPDFFCSTKMLVLFSIFRISKQKKKNNNISRDVIIKLGKIVKEW